MFYQSKTLIEKVFQVPNVYLQTSVGDLQISTTDMAVAQSLAMTASKK